MLRCGTVSSHQSKEQLQVSPARTNARAEVVLFYTALPSARGDYQALSISVDSPGGQRCPSTGVEASSPRGTSAQAAASVAVSKHYLARPCRMLWRAIFAQSQNQQQQITLQTMESAPAQRGSKLQTDSPLGQSGVPPPPPAPARARAHGAGAAAAAGPSQGALAFPRGPGARWQDSLASGHRAAGAPWRRGQRSAGCQGHPGAPDSAQGPSSGGAPANRGPDPTGRWAGVSQPEAGLRRPLRSPFSSHRGREARARGSRPGREAGSETRGPS